MTSPSQAILVLTHVRNARVAAHIERLRRETAHLLPVFVCMDDRQAREDSAPDFAADLTVDLVAAERLMPSRTANDMRVWGFPNCDVYFVPAMLSPLLAEFEHLWLVEVDVDFAGHWGTFFETAMQSTADLVATTVYPRPYDPNWVHWGRLQPPSHVVPEFQIRAFLPLSRYSRRLLEAFVEETNLGRWAGIYEAIFPSLAFDRGWEIADPGGSGPFLWDGPSYYSNTFSTVTISPGTFVAKPARGFYFHEDPSAFPESGLLYHPVKGWTPLV